MMRSIYIKDFDALRKTLEDPGNWKHYSGFVGGGRILRAKVEMYEHDDGARIAGKDGRWWVYVHVEYVPRSRGAVSTRYEYDIALWKLIKTPLFKALVEKGAVEIREESNYETVTA